VSAKRISRRDFLSRSAVTAAGLFVSSCTRGFPRNPRPAFAGTDVTSIDTRWPIKRVVYLMLENRSFDHIFGAMPGVNGVTMGDMAGTEVPLRPCPEWLPGDLPHDRAAALKSVNGGRMDGFALGAFGREWAYRQFREPQIPNYWHWAREYVLGDNTFSSVLGPSYPNHFFFVAGQGGGAIDNPENIQVRREGDTTFKSWGCDAYGDDVYVLVEDEDGNLTKHDSCFDFRTYGEELSERDIDWAYYSSAPGRPGYIWQAYSAMRNVYGTELWEEHIWDVDDLLMDIDAAALPAVTWVTPQFELSDHPPMSSCHAHDWVTDVVNGIMTGSMWEHTAIFITWDEWGGLYDHVRPPVKPSPTGGSRIWEWGIRVPMLVISPYARRGYVDDAEAEFSAPLRFIADNWDLPYLTNAVEDAHNYEHVFDFARRPRPPDPRAKKGPCFTKDPVNFPESYPGWPADVTPSPPDFARQ
jgi:phospholipase C